MKQPRGVTLIELMVGLAIGLLAIVVITQVMTIWEGRKRSTTSGSDAQVNGALALQQLQRDIQGAGYGSTMQGGVGCWVRSRLGGTTQPDYRLAPVVITDGGGSASDTVRVLMSNPQNHSLPINTASNHTRGDSQFTVVSGTNIGNQEGDLMMVVPASGCTPGATPTVYASLFNISTTPSAATITHATGNTGPWNQDIAGGTVFPGTASSDLSYAAGSYLINLGALDSTRGVPLYRDYSVNAQTLTMTTFTAAGSVISATGSRAVATATSPVEDLSTQIVNLQAVYGKDTGALDGVADTWNTVEPTTTEEWRRIVAVRIALVARSRQYEAEAVTPAKPGDCSTLTATSTFPKWKPDGVTYDCLDVSGLTDYQHYRYRVFEIVVPLRNMIWQS